MTGTGIIERCTSQLTRRAGMVVAVAIALRLVVALFLAAGPATDEIGELAGWDAERFQEIAERDGPAWVDHPVEYPPGSVLVFDRLAGDDVVETHRRLVVLSVILDLGVALALARRVGRPSATAYLWLGLPLVPFGYQRLDTLVTTIAVVAALAILGPARSAGTERSGARAGPEARARVGVDVGVDVVAAVAIAAGAMIKVWPALLIVGAMAIGRWRAAVAAAVSTGAAGLVWLAVVGDGLGPVDQVVSLRGATGWHVESLPGALVALVGSERAELELNAYRIGTLRPGLVTTGRVLAVVTMGLLAIGGLRRFGALTSARGGEGAEKRAGEYDRPVFALATLGSVAALVVTAPLLSPQFLVWLVPFAAMAWPSRPTGPGSIRVGPALLATATAAALTGVALHGFGPDDLTGFVPASLLTIRNLALIAVTGTCLAALWPTQPSKRPAQVTKPGTTRRRPAGAPGPRPRPGRSGSAGR